MKEIKIQAGAKRGAKGIKSSRTAEFEKLKTIEDAIYKIMSSINKILKKVLYLPTSKLGK